MLNLLNVHFDNHIPHWRTPMERISFHILVLVMEGKVHYSINGAEYIGEQGDFLFIPQESLRSGQNEGGETHSKYTLAFRTDPQRETDIPFVDRRRFIKCKISNSKYVGSRFNRLFEELRSSRRYRRTISLGIAQELLGLFAEELEKPALTPMKLKYAEAMHSFLLSRYREPVQIEQIAGLINRTPGYASALFKEAYGFTPIRYMHELRVEEARKLLLHSNMTISDIAHYLGYYDPSYFFKMFKKAAGMSPTAFIASEKDAPH